MRIIKLKILMLYYSKAKKEDNFNYVSYKKMLLFLFFAGLYYSKVFLMSLFIRGIETKKELGLIKKLKST